MTQVPVQRQAVRAVVIDGQGRTLLFKAFPDQTRSRHFWITPGGGVNAGESDESALRRELREECGLLDFEIGRQVWTRNAAFPLPSTGEMIDQWERFYLVRIDAHEVDITGWDEFEREFMTEPRWWRLEELERSTEDFAPSGLPRHLADLLRGRIPAEPLNVGT